MPIYRTIPASNFTITHNVFANDASISATATTALLYLTSKPPHWKFNAHDLKKRLNVGLNKVYRCMRELIRAGYVTYQRIQSGTIWNIYDTPQNLKTATDHVESHRVNFEHIQNECVLERTESLEINKPLPTQPPEIHKSTEHVVVDSGELIYPVQLNPVQKKAAKHIIKKVKQPELQQPVLFALAYAIAQNKVKSAPAYLQGLVTRANNGTFEPVGAATAINHGGKPLIPIWQGFGQSTPSKPEAAKGFIQQAKLAARGAL